MDRKESRPEGSIVGGGLKSAGPYCLGAVFVFFVTHAADDGNTTAWLLGFLDGFFLHVFTQSSGGDDHE